MLDRRAHLHIVAALPTPREGFRMLRLRTRRVVILAMVHIMVRRLARNEIYGKSAGQTLSPPYSGRFGPDANSLS
ncbi:hypothetical protein HYPGJ_20152 [Hyphomicrobium sp. GJ21]|nr:hypothetical protein HYPGJ_20152 [Hyphomicrobium sp. GJ21]